MIYQSIIVYLFIKPLSCQHLHLLSPLINDPANKGWTADPQLLISFDNESLWRLINIGGMMGMNVH